MDAESLYLKGKEAADRGNYEYAIAMFLDVVTEFPDHNNARLGLRACEEQVFQSRGRGFAAKATAVLKGLGPLLKITFFSGNPRRTVAACEKFLVNWPSYVPVLLKLAHALRRLGQPQAAISTLEYATHREPQNVKVLWTLGGLYEEVEDYPKASRCFDSILHFRPTDDDAKRKLKDLQSMGHMQKTHLDEGASSMDTVRDMEQQKELMQSDMIVKTVDQLDKDVAEIQGQLKADQGDSLKWLRLGDLYAQQEKYKLALQAYQRSNELEARYQAREKCGDMQLRIYRDDLKAAAEALERSPNDLQAKARHEEALRRRAQHAVEEFDFRVGQHPTEVRLAEMLGDAYLLRNHEGDLDRAILQFQRAVDDPRCRSRALRKLGSCFARSEATYDMALAQYERARAATVRLLDQKEIDYEIAVLNERLGHVDDALTAYKRIYEVDAGFMDVGEKIVKLSRLKSSAG